MHTLDILVVYHEENRYLIPFSDILYLEADGKTTWVYYLKQSAQPQICEVLSYKNLGYYVQLLQTSPLVQTHRSYMVNMYQVEEIVKNQVVFKHPVETKIYLTGKFRKNLNNRLPQ